MNVTRRGPVGAAFLFGPGKVGTTGELPWPGQGAYLLFKLCCFGGSHRAFHKARSSHACHGLHAGSHLAGHGGLSRASTMQGVRMQGRSGIPESCHGQMRRLQGIESKVRRPSDTPVQLRKCARHGPEQGVCIGKVHQGPGLKSSDGRFTAERQVLRLLAVSVA